MVEKIAYFLIFGKPLNVYLGILTLLSLLFTASIGYANFRGIKWVPFKYHPKMATVTVILAIIHGLMGLSSYFNF